MKNSSSGIRLFAAALNYASKIAHGDPEYTLEKAEKIFPPKYFVMVAKEYSNLMELNRYAKTRRILLAKASWSYQYAADYIQLSDQQLNELREVKKNWQDEINKHKMNNEDRKTVTEFSRTLDEYIAKLGNLQNVLKKWFYKTGLLQSNASINNAINKATKVADSIINATVGIKARMIVMLHLIITKEQDNE